MKLETKRLILRKPRLSDLEDIFEGVKEYDVARTTEAIPHPYKRKDAKNWITKSIKNWGKDSYNFVLKLKSEKKVIGVLALININKKQGTASTGSWVNKKYWRNGYMTEAKIIVNDFAFNKLKLRRLESSVYKENKASNSVQIKMGYKLEGTKRKSVISTSTGKISDGNIYGLLKEDWKKAKAKLVK